MMFKTSNLPGQFSPTATLRNAGMKAQGQTTFAAQVQLKFHRKLEFATSTINIL